MVYFWQLNFSNKLHVHGFLSELPQLLNLVPLKIYPTFIISTKNNKNMKLIINVKNIVKFT